VTAEGVDGRVTEFLREMAEERNLRLAGRAQKAKEDKIAKEKQGS